MKRNNTIISCLVILAYSFSLAGCDGDEKKALQEAEQARIETADVKRALSKAEAEISDLSELLYTAKSAREKLEQQVQLLTAERDNAAAQTLQHQEAMQGAANTDDPVVTALRAEIAQLNKLVAQQQTVIAEQDEAIAELAENIQPAEEMVEVLNDPGIVEPTIEPNEPL